MSNNEEMNMSMTDEKWKQCNNMIGRIMTYLDDDEVRRATKKAIKSEIWDFYNEHVNGDDYEQTAGNR